MNLADGPSVEHAGCRGERLYSASKQQVRSTSTAYHREPPPTAHGTHIPRRRRTVRDPYRTELSAGKLNITRKFGRISWISSGNDLRGGPLHTQVSRQTVLITTGEASQEAEAAETRWKEERQHTQCRETTLETSPYPVKSDVRPAKWTTL